MGLVPPYLIDVSFTANGNRRRHIWLPLILLWPLLLVLGVLALVFTILADVVLLALGQPYHRYTRLLIGCFALLPATRGTTVYVRNPRSLVDLTIR